MKVGILCGLALAASAASANTASSYFFLRQSPINFRTGGSAMMGADSMGDNKPAYYYVRPGFATHDDFQVFQAYGGLVSRTSSGRGSFSLSAGYVNQDPDGGSDTDGWIVGGYYQISEDKEGFQLSPWFYYGEADQAFSMISFGASVGAVISPMNDIYGEFSVGYMEIDPQAGATVDGATYEASLRGRLPYTAAGLRGIYLQFGYAWPTEEFGSENYYGRAIFDVNSNLELWLTAARDGLLGADITIRF
jgi:hypothetical protein